MKKKQRIFFELLLVLILAAVISCYTSEDEKKDDEGSGTTHQVGFYLSWSVPNNCDMDLAAVNYYAAGQGASGVLVHCSSNAWYKVLSNIPGNTTASLTLEINNGPSYGGNGNLYMSLSVDGVSVRNQTLTLSTHQTASLSYYIP